MQKKIKKTIYVPTWIGQLLDAEGDRYDGPGVVAATAIYAFCSMDHASQAAALEAFRSREIKEVYSQDTSNEADASALFAEVAEVVKCDKSGTRILSQAASVALGKLVADLGPEYIAQCQTNTTDSAPEADANEQKRKRRHGSSKSA